MHARTSRCMVTAVAAAMTIGAAGCGKKAPKAGAVVRIGSSTVSQTSFDAFRKMKRMYPTGMGDVFPGKRSDITFLVETELICRKAAPFIGVHPAVASRDWKWKSRYFPAHLMLQDVLEKDLGITDGQVQAYYNAHRSEFKDSVTRFEPVKAPGIGDSTKKIDSAGVAAQTPVRHDSVFIRGVAEVRSKIVENVFLQQNPPDKEFTAERLKEDSTLTPARIGRMWLVNVRSNLPGFFMRKLYKDRFGKVLGDSIDVFYGKGKLITPEDMDVILTWIPDAQRENYRSDPTRKRDLAKWLLKWELLSAEANRSGYMSKAEPKAVLAWAKKVEIADYFVKNTLLPKLGRGVTIDSLAATFLYWDNQYRLEVPVDSARFARNMQDYRDAEVSKKVDQFTYGLRKATKVVFLQPDWKDQRSDDPVKIAAAADSARDSGNADGAQTLYEALASDFAFTPEGDRALGEVAKIHTEKERYSQAIKAYRSQLLSGADESKKCNVYFMIGFIYDEYLNKPDLAEVNYKWVLKYAPDCDLADDAEFMCLHLDEPMTSVEELRGEALRQGRDIGNDAAEADTLQAAPAEPAVPAPKS